MIVDGRDIPLVLLRPRHDRKISNREYGRIRASILAVGLIEPLLVFPENDYYILMNPVSIRKTNKDGDVTEQIQAKWGDDATHAGGLADYLAAKTDTTDPVHPVIIIPQSEYTARTTYAYAHKQLTSVKTYYDLTGGLYNETDYGYDAVGRQNKTVTPGGTITRVLSASVKNLFAAMIEATGDGR